MNVQSDSLLLRRMEFFHQYDIEVWLRKEVSLSSLSCVITAIAIKRWSFFHFKVRINLELKGLSFQALSVDTDMRTVTFDDGTVQTYDQLLISTGCRCRNRHTAEVFFLSSKPFLTFVTLISIFCNNYFNHNLIIKELSLRGVCFHFLLWMLCTFAQQILLKVKSYMYIYFLSKQTVQYFLQHCLSVILLYFIFI